MSAIPIGQLEDLVRDLAWADPVAVSTDGLDAWCFFCKSDRTVFFDVSPPRQGVMHPKTCAWVRARLAMGLPLGVENRVEREV